MKVQDCSLTEAVTCEKGQTISEVASKFKESGVRHIIITEDNIPVGIISASDIVIKVVAENKDYSIKVEEVMTSPVSIIKEDEDLQTCFIAMVKKSLNCCPVIDENSNLKGMVILTEVMSKLNKNVN